MNISAPFILRPIGTCLLAAGLFLLGAMNGSIDWYRPERFDIGALAREFAALVAPAGPDTPK